MKVSDGLVTDRKSLTFKFGEIEVQEGEFALSLGGASVPVEPKAFRVLLYLLRNPGRVVSKDEILIAVWDDCSVSDNSLTRSIATLRRLMHDDSREPRYIATVPTVGYRFVCPVLASEGTPHERTGQLLSETVSFPAHLETERTTASARFLDSIVVLPLKNAGVLPAIEYLCDGITESLINSLSQLNGLRVVPRTTAFRYKDAKIDPAEIGRELRVRVALVGFLSQRGERLIICLELIDATHESQLWGVSYDYPLEDILSVQAEVAADISATLRLRLSEEEKKRLAKRPTRSREAYHFYLRAMHWGNKWTPEGLGKGIEYIRRALDLDPAYAEAWTGLAYLYVLAGIMGGASPTETFPRARAAAQQALDIDDRETGAHASLAFVKLVYDWDWQGALLQLQHAIEVAPNLAGGHYVYSFWYVTQGLYGQAAAEARIALDIDPLSVRYSYLAGFISFCAGQSDLAIEQLYMTIELDPSFTQAYGFLAYSYARKQMRSEAIAALSKIGEDTVSGTRGSALRAIVDAQTGRPGEAQTILQMLRRGLKSPDFAEAYQCAVLHALLGEIDESFDCLDMAFRGRSVMLIYLAIAPNLENLHDDPRFFELIRRIGIPVSAVLNKQTKMTTL